MEREIAKWMNTILRRDKILYQEVIVYEIMKKFGEQYTYYNDNGNPAISKKVLAEYKKLTPDAKWSRGGRYWIIESGYEDTGRQID